MAAPKKCVDRAMKVVSPISDLLLLHGPPKVADCTLAGDPVRPSSAKDQICKKSRSLSFTSKTFHSAALCKSSFRSNLQEEVIGV